MFFLALLCFVFIDVEWLTNAIPDVISGRSPTDGSRFKVYQTQLRERKDAIQVTCGFRTTSFEGIIASPFSSSTTHYSAFQCTWNIVAPTGYKIRLEATLFQLPGSMGSCGSYDYVTITSLRPRKSEVSHGMFCGSSTMPKLISEENELRIQYYYRDNRYQQRKVSYFSFTYRAVPPSVYNLTKEWIANNTQVFYEVPENIPRSVSSLFLFNETYFLQDNATATNLTTQFKLKLAADLVRNLTYPLSAAALSHHVTALLAICSNPRSVFGVDLVDELRRLVDKKTGLANPYYFLTLCNAGDKLTTTDIRRMNSIIESHKQDMYWVDFQAMALMTLVCAKEQNKSDQDVARGILAASILLKRRQLDDGSFGSLQTTSLVVQALTAANSVAFGWKREAAVNFIGSANNTNGSFGNLYNLYAAIPVISDKTMLHINSSRCDFTSEGLIPLKEVKNKLAEPIHVLYSIWIGDKVDYSYTVTIKVPTGTKFLDFMRVAAEREEKFQFRWKYVKDVPYVYEINGFVNDPSSGKYWTFLTGRDLTKLRPDTEGLHRYIPNDGDVAVMWYKTVTIEYHWNEVDVNQTTTVEPP